MALPQGINFRETQAFVTDISPATYEGGNNGTPASGAYPSTSPQGNSIGFETNTSAGYQTRNRNAGNDARLAGTAFTDGAIGGAHTYRIDLPSAGVYNIGCACGEANYATTTAIVIKDGASTLAAIAGTATTGANLFRDATDTEYSAANWPSSQTLVPRTFSSTIFRVLISDAGPGAALCFVAHVYIELSSLSPKRFALSPG